MRYGFEFTVPLTLSRFLARSRGEDAEVNGEGRRDGDTSVEMRSVQFVPVHVRVRAGSAVVWKNNDQVVHTVTAADGSWTSPLLDPGQTYRRVFTTAGTYQIVCQPHPFMKSVVEVVP